MINALIDFSIKNKFIIGLFTLALAGAGIYSMLNVPIDAVPDITSNQVQVITQAPNLGTDDIEQFITYPVEVAMSNLPRVQEIRSVSRFGLSVVTIVFDDGMGTYLPRQLVAEKLTKVRGQIPEGFGTPTMGPITTGLGEIYQYTLEVDPKYKNEYSNTELRTIQDWLVRRQMTMVPGVVEVNAIGGNTKQYEVAVNPDELNAIGLDIAEVFQALKRNNQNTGGAYIEKNHRANFIRGEGLAHGLGDIENTVIKTVNNIPIRIKDIAQVGYGSAIRYGALTKDGKGEAVGGIVMMLKEANSNNVITEVKMRIAQIQQSLPEGVHIVPFLDRSTLIKKTTRTISHNLIEGGLVVIFILVILLGNWRGGLIVASTIPLSLFFAFILMNVFDVWANLMSLGAIDFGIIVDGAVIIVESTVFFLSQHISKGKPLNQTIKDEVTYQSAKKMMNPAFFGQLIILIVFVPILVLEGVEGKMFKPMALTFIFAMLGAMLLCLTYVPMISSLFLNTSPGWKVNWGDRFVHWLENKYQIALNYILKKVWVVVVPVVLLLAVMAFVFSRLGGEFIPQLDEGDIAFHVILKPGSALSESIETTTKVETLILENFPEVNHVVSRIGVADVPTDPMPMDLADVIVTLKPQSEWVTATTKTDLIALIKKELEVIPGVNYEFTQPIEMRFNELLTGIREDVAIKLFGEDLQILSDKAGEIADIISSVDGVADMRVEATTGLPQMTVDYHRDKLAQYGLHVNNLNVLIESAFAGKNAGVIFEGEKKFDLVIRLKEQYRASIEDIKNLYVSLPNGSQIPLQEVADISYEAGAMQISRDNTNRRTYVGINVRGRDIKSLVAEIQQKLSAQLQLPPGYYIRYGGAFENLERATSRLQIVVPIVLAVIFILIYFALRSFTQTLMIYLAIPLSAIGGVLSLFLRGMPFSISAGIGFIVLFGVAVLNGLVLISSLNELKEQGIDDINKRLCMGTKRRIRPILLTALTDILGFLPMAISTSPGSEVQQPLATVVIGGLFTSTFLTLFVLPILYQWAASGKLKAIPRLLPLIIIFFGVFRSGNAKAQPPQDFPTISIEEAVQKARGNYPSLKAAELEIQRQQALKNTAWDLGNTQVFTGAEEQGSEVDGVYTTIGIQQQQIDLFSIGAKNKLGNEKIALAEKAYDLSTLQLEKVVKQSWGDVYTAKKLFFIYNELDSIYQQFEKAASIRYKTEATSRLEYLSAGNQARQMEIKREQAWKNYQIAIQKLNLWLVGDTLFSVPDKWSGFDNIYTLSEQENWGNHPEIQLAQQQVKVANATKTVSNAAFLPKVNAMYGRQKVNNETGFYTYQLGVSVPLFFIPGKGKVQAASINVEKYREQLKQRQYEIQSQYFQLIQHYEKWLNSWHYYQDEALKLADEQKAGAILAYREGAIDYVAFIQILKDVATIELDALAALRNFLNIKYELEYYKNITE